MLKIQMLEQIVTNESVAEDDKQHNDAEQSTSRTPINLSPQRNGYAYIFSCLLLLYLMCFFLSNHTMCVKHTFEIIQVLNN